MIRLEFFISSSRMENAWRSIGISKEGEKDFVEIDVAEYEIRQKMHEERLEKMKKDCNGCFGAANNDCLRCEEELQYESE
ncbi:MAG: hypothetical protein ACLT76_09150 [Clostridium fessum]